jgi:CTP:phosphocholine cytidylyltransferase-like protein
MNYNLNRKPNLSQAVIFCGGLDTRLRSVTRNYSKTLLKINNTRNLLTNKDFQLDVIYIKNIFFKKFK